MEKQMDLILRLKSATTAGKIEWKTTADDETFLYSSKLNSLTISRFMGEEGPIVRVALFNSSGEEVDSFTDDELTAYSRQHNLRGSWWSDMSNLHTSAKRAALGSDKILDEFLGELPPPPKDPDDIPF